MITVKNQHHLYILYVEVTVYILYVHKLFLLGKSLFCLNYVVSNF